MDNILKDKIFKDNIPKNNIPTNIIFAMYLYLPCLYTQFVPNMSFIFQIFSPPPKQSLAYLYLVGNAR